MTTTIIKASEAILEFVRGHTNLVCEVVDQFLLTQTTSDDVLFRIVCKPERINNKRQPTSLIMETLAVSISGIINRKKQPDEADGRIEINDPSEFNAIELRSVNNFCHVSCLFEWVTPIGGTNGVARNFCLRHGNIFLIE